MRPNYKYLTLILLTLSILTNFSSFSQRILRFDSLYVNELGVPGEAAFNYYLDRGKVIKSGDFSFKAEWSDNLCPTHLIKENWTGSYRENQKHNEWTYTVKEYNVVIKSISDEEMEYDVYLVQSDFKVNYNRGDFDDKFTYERTQYINDEKKRTLEKLELTFSDNKVNGEINYQKNDTEESVSIKGKAFKGLMDGTWTFNHSSAEIVEKRKYKKGVLISLFRESGKDTLEYLEFPLSEEIQHHLDNKHGDFEMADKPLSLLFSDGYPRNCQYISAQKVYNEYLGYMLDITFLFDQDNELKHGLVLGTNRGYYPLSNREKDLLKGWPEQEFKYRKTLQRANDQLFLNIRYREDSMMQVLSEWIIAQESLLEYIKPWDEILFKDQLEFYYRKGLVMDYARSVLENDSIYVHDSLLIFNYDTEKKHDDFLSYLHANFGERMQMGDSIINMVDRRLGTLYLADEVGVLNVEIIRAKSKMDSIYKHTNFNMDIAPFAHNATNFYLTTYFEIEYDFFLEASSISVQKESGAELLKDLIVLQDIHKEFGIITERMNLLDSLYTEYSFDPFTYSDKVPVRAKKKLYDIVAMDMFYKMLTRIDPMKSEPGDVLNALHLISTLQKRLIFLRDKDTKKLERKLRSNKSLKDRLELLQIE